MNINRDIVIEVLQLVFTDSQCVPLNYSEDEWSELYRFAHRQQLIPCVYNAVRRTEANVPKEIYRKLRNTAVESVLVEEQQLEEIQKLIHLFDENSIDYLPLKGTVIKKMYPGLGLRPMGDVDILIRMEQYPFIKQLLTDNGYSEGKESDHEYVWTTSDCLYIELHKKLVSTRNKDMIRYFGDGWALAIKDCGHCYKLSDEDTFVFLFVHFAKHYRASGVGIRHMLDIWVFRKSKPNLDMEKVNNALSIIGLNEFFDNVWHTLNVWFAKVEPNAVTDRITEWLFANGGLVSQRNEEISSLLREAEGTQNYGLAEFRMLRKRVFPTKEAMQIKYPCCKRYPVVLPVMWGVHILCGIRNVLRKMLGTENENTKNRWDTAELVEYKKHLDMVGLKMK